MDRVGVRAGGTVPKRPEIGQRISVRITAPTREVLDHPARRAVVGAVGKGQRRAVDDRGHHEIVTQDVPASGVCYFHRDRLSPELVHGRSKPQDPVGPIQGHARRTGEKVEDERIPLRIERLQRHFVKEADRGRAHGSGHKRGREIVRPERPRENVSGIRNPQRFGVAVVVGVKPVIIIDVIGHVDVKEGGKGAVRAADLLEPVIGSEAAAHHDHVIASLGPDQLTFRLLGPGGQVGDGTVVNNRGRVIGVTLIGLTRARENRGGGVGDAQSDLALTRGGKPTVENGALPRHTIGEIEWRSKIHFPIPRFDEIALRRVDVERTGAVEKNVFTHGRHVRAGRISRGEEWRAANSHLHRIGVGELWGVIVADLEADDVGAEPGKKVGHDRPYGIGMIEIDAIRAVKIPAPLDHAIGRVLMVGIAPVKDDRVGHRSRGGAHLHQRHRAFLKEGTGEDEHRPGGGDVLVVHKPAGDPFLPKPRSAGTLAVDRHTSEALPGIHEPVLPSGGQLLDRRMSDPHGFGDGVIGVDVGGRDDAAPIGG